MASELWGAGEIQCLRDGGRSPHSSSCICRIQLEFQFLRHFFVLLSAVLPVTTLRQRLLQPDFQPICASQLYPRHKHLLIKRSLRCRVGNSIQKSAFSRLTELGCWEMDCVFLFLKKHFNASGCWKFSAKLVVTALRGWGRLSHLWCDDSCERGTMLSKMHKDTKLVCASALPSQGIREGCQYSWNQTNFAVTKDKSQQTKY